MTGFGSQMMAEVHGTKAQHRYRSAIPMTGGSIGAFGFFFLGIFMVVDGFRAGVGETVVGASVVAVAGLIAGGVATTFAELTPTGLAYRYNFRRKMIPWASVESFRVARGQATGAWYSLVVELRGNGPLMVRSIVGTKRYVVRVIGEIEEFRAQIGPDPVPQHRQQAPDGPGAERS